jgi:hypothetical protein
LTTRSAPITGKAETQAGTDTGGTWTKVADGDYWYTFGRKLPANTARDIVITIGAYGSRNLSEFELPTNYDDDVYHLRLDGTAVSVGREVVMTAACNNCHNPGAPAVRAAHGYVCAASRKPSIDTGTRSTCGDDHGFHERRSHSVVCGKYQIIGNQQNVHDYSN